MYAVDVAAAAARHEAAAERTTRETALNFTLEIAEKKVTARNLHCTGPSVVKPSPPSATEMPCSYVDRLWLCHGSGECEACGGGFSCCAGGRAG